MATDAQASRSAHAVTYLFAPLVLNILFFLAYLHASVQVFDADTARLANESRNPTLQLLRLGGFSFPIVYVLIRTQLLSRSISGHEIALLIFSAWVLAGMGDVVRLLRFNIISNYAAVLFGVKIAAFAIVSLFGTAFLVQYCKRMLLKERHLFLERSAILALFSLAYASVALMVLAVHSGKVEESRGLYAGATAVIALLIALNIYGFFLFRTFYLTLGNRAYSPKPDLESSNESLLLTEEQARVHFDELFSTIDLLGDKNQSVAVLQQRLREIASTMRHDAIANVKYPAQILQPAPPVVRMIDRTKPARFLIIDGNPLSRRVLSEHLVHHSTCRADFAESGKDGLHAALSLGYDIIFVALDITDMPGIAVARSLREHGLYGALVAYADANVGLEPDAQIAGFDRYLERPISGKELSLHVESLLLGGQTGSNLV